jgi:hypothetical protein
MVVCEKRLVALAVDFSWERKYEKEKKIFKIRPFAHSFVALCPRVLWLDWKLSDTQTSVYNTSSFACYLLQPGPRVLWLAGSLC